MSASKTVTVRSPVDGQLEKVAFTEGQMVKEGDPLFVIDSQSFHMQLIEARGRLLLDEGRHDEAVVRVDQAAIDAAQLQVDECTIKAPISGRIGLRIVDQGNVVRAGDEEGLAVITQTQPMIGLFTLPEADLPRIRKALALNPSLPVEAWDRTNARIATGTVTGLDNQIDAATGTFKLKAVFANGGNALFPNQFVQMRLLMDTLKNATLVPAAAIQRVGDSSFVYVVKEGATGREKVVERRAVTLGASDGNLTQVIAGLAPGDVVVVGGADQLHDGQKIPSFPELSDAVRSSRG